MALSQSEWPTEQTSNCCCSWTYLDPFFTTKGGVQGCVFVVGFNFIGISINVKLPEINKRIANSSLNIRFNKFSTN